MSILYPQMRLSVASRRFAELHGKSLAELAGLADADMSSAVFSPVGGQRCTADELVSLRQRILEHARSHEYPNAARLAQRNAFDRAVGIELHTTSGMMLGEASIGAVWAFLALQLLPDVCVWRFPPKSSGMLTADRFKASDLTRHTLARTWTRAFTLCQPNASDPYKLLAGIAEADLDQIMARRRSVAAVPALVREIVHCHAVDETPDGVSNRAVLRDSLTRLLRMAAFMDLGSLTDAQLRDLVRETRASAAAGLLLA